MSSADTPNSQLACVEITITENEIWYQVINSIISFVTATTSLASTLRSPALFRAEQQPRTQTIRGKTRAETEETSKVQFATKDQVTEFYLSDFPWFIEVLTPVSTAFSKVLEPPLSLYCPETSQGEPEYNNTHPHLLTITDTRQEMGDVRTIVTGDLIQRVFSEVDIAHAANASTVKDKKNKFIPPLPYKDESDECCFFEDFTDSEGSLDSSNLQDKFEELAQNEEARPEETCDVNKDNNAKHKTYGDTVTDYYLAEEKCELIDSKQEVNAHGNAVECFPVMYLKNPADDTRECIYNMRQTQELEELEKEAKTEITKTYQLLEKLDKRRANDINENSDDTKAIIIETKPRTDTPEVETSSVLEKFASVPTKIASNKTGTIQKPLRNAPDQLQKLRGQLLSLKGNTSTSITNRSSYVEGKRKLDVSSKDKSTMDLEKKLARLSNTDNNSPRATGAIKKPDSKLRNTNLKTNNSKVLKSRIPSTSSKSPMKNTPTTNSNVNSNTIVETKVNTVVKDSGRPLQKARVSNSVPIAKTLRMFHLNRAKQENLIKAKIENSVSESSNSNTNNNVKPKVTPPNSKPASPPSKTRIGKKPLITERPVTNTTKIVLPKKVRLGAAETLKKATNSLRTSNVPRPNTAVLLAKNKR